MTESTRLPLRPLLQLDVQTDVLVALFRQRARVNNLVVALLLR
jgi:hypothetical protein